MWGQWTARQQRREWNRHDIFYISQQQQCSLSIRVIDSLLNLSNTCWTRRTQIAQMWRLQLFCKQTSVGTSTLIALGLVSRLNWSWNNILAELQQHLSLIFMVHWKGIPMFVWPCFFASSAIRPKVNNCWSGDSVQIGVSQHLMALQRILHIHGWMSAAFMVSMNIWFPVCLYSLSPKLDVWPKTCRTNDISISLSCTLFLELISQT